MPHDDHTDRRRLLAAAAGMAGLTLISGNEAHASQDDMALKGRSTDGNVPGVLGENTAGEGVRGVTSSPGTAAVTGFNKNPEGTGAGVYGEAQGKGHGVFGKSQNWEGIRGETQSASGAGVAGVQLNPGGTGAGVYGENKGRGAGVFGLNKTGIGVEGVSEKITSIDSPPESVEFNTIGVQGTGPIGVRGRGNPGVMGVSAATGVYGIGDPGLLVKTLGHNLIIGKSPAAVADRTPVPIQTVFRVDRSGRGFFNGGTQQSGADVAEFITASDALHPGDVVEIDPERPGQFRRSTTANTTAVAGVISANPGVTLGAEDAAGPRPITAPQLALVGRVPVKVSAENGAIRPGDLLVASSTPGHAMRAPANPGSGTVIGKALGKLDVRIGIIDMLVTLI